ncbi:transglycosylase SLT domain-containing protein [Candidatus Bipolaricaulota bacterium]|nr:transglycosylase SLT domain-containing protein [Candidatus Bipolaricaulota bacterium]
MKAMLGPLLVLGMLLGLSILLAIPSASPPELAGWQALWRAQEGLPGTLPELEALAVREDGVGWQARVLAGRTHAAAGNYQAAVVHFRIALALRATSDLRQELALALEGAGRPQEALAEWERLLPRREAVQAVIRLEHDPVQAASLLNGAGQYADALALVVPLTGTRAALERARALAGLGRVKEAVVEYERYLAASSGDTGVRLAYGQALERAGEAERALAVYRALGAAGAYSVGRLLEAMGRMEEAIAAYRASADPEARWRAARLLEAAGREGEALALYRELAQGTHRVRDDAALRAYLLYRRRGEAEKAADMAKLLPSAFTWLLGAYRPPPVPTLAPDPPHTTPQAVRVADALVRHLPGKEGEAWARVELEVALKRAPVADKLAIGEWFYAQGDWRSAFRIGSEVLAVHPCPRGYRLAYPLAHWDTVQRWASAYGVDPLLVLAVMREESGFSLSAVSSSDARGLMQLLPSTARWIAEEKLKGTYREADLFQPEVNIQLGTWYLGHLLGQFGGDVAKAVAAYNGGPGNVQRWTAAGLSPADLPGALVSSETREYLAKVLQSWLVYRWLYSP